MRGWDASGIFGFCLVLCFGGWRFLLETAGFHLVALWWLDPCGPLGVGMVMCCRLVRGGIRLLRARLL